MTIDPNFNGGWNMTLTDIQSAIAQQVQSAYDQGLADGKAAVQPAPAPTPQGVTVDQVLAVLDAEDADLKTKIQALFQPAPADPTQQPAPAPTN